MGFQAEGGANTKRQHEGRVRMAYLRKGKKSLRGQRKGHMAGKSGKT